MRRACGIGLMLVISVAGCDDAGGIHAAGDEDGPCLADGTCSELLTCTQDFLCEDLGYCDAMDTSECVCQNGSVGGRICHVQGTWGLCTCLASCDDGVCGPVEDHQSCPQDCIAVVCGDGVVSGDEDCDDGNASNNDGCLSACAAWDDCCVANICGDGYVDESPNGNGGQVEACDDGNLVGGDACWTDCRQDMTLCGNGQIDQNEVCDDGNTVDGDACSSTCRQNMTLCGDGVIDSGEACDEGVANSDTTPDACRTDCSAPGCGDLVIDTGEACDDGNIVDGDGCSGDCSTVE